MITINHERVKEFISLNCLEIHTLNNKVLSIGIKWGYSNYFKANGFKRNEQIAILNYLEKTHNF